MDFCHPCSCRLPGKLAFVVVVVVVVVVVLVNQTEIKKSSIWYYVSEWKQIKIQINVPPFLQLEHITNKSGIDRAQREYIV